MTTRQAGMVLAVGWALLLPPAGERSAQAPLAQWQYVASFDSANECEAIRVELIKATRRPLGDPWAVADLGDPVRIGREASWLDSRCAMRDEPRGDSRD